MLDALGEWMGFPYNYSMYSGETVPKKGPHHATIAPYGPYKTGDGKFVFLAVQSNREVAQKFYYIINIHLVEKFL